MKTVLIYTVLSGDSLSAIAEEISNSAGISWEAIAQANPTVDSNALQIGEVIDIPAVNGETTTLNYTIIGGDSLSGISAALDQCHDLTYQQITADNLGIDADNLTIGQLLNIPATDSAIEQPPLVPAENMGYWHRSSVDPINPTDATLSIAFSGYTDVDTALNWSAGIKDSLVGVKYICFGGGNAAGSFNSAGVQAITQAINAGSLSGYDGIGYDVEEGVAGLEADFAASFAAAKAKGFKVLVTVSHSAPYGITDAPELMKSFFANPDIDLLSPQLYTDGTEPENDYDISQGVVWRQYADCQAAVVPSIVKDTMYSDAQTYFANEGVTLQGYIQWSQVS